MICKSEAPRLTIQKEIWILYAIVLIYLYLLKMMPLCLKKQVLAL
jgi:hypothetical protein